LKHIPERNRRIRIVLTALIFLLIAVPYVGLIVSTARAIGAKVSYAKISTDRTYRTVYTGQRVGMNIICSSSRKHPKPELVFRSSDRSVASVSNAGEIHAKKPGEAVITCTSEDGQRLRLKLFVRRRSKKIVYLTYDDGPGASNTPKLLKVLDKYDAKATFFIVGSQAKNNKNIVKQELEAGHTVGIHTYTHDYDKIYKSRDAYMKDFDRTADLLQKISGQRTYFVRMPGGSNNGFVRPKTARAIIRSLHSRGYHVMDWTAGSQDAVGIEYGTRTLTRYAISTSRGQKVKVILMHDSDAKPHTAAVTKNVIKYYKKRGYTFESLENYTGGDILFLDMTSGSRKKSSKTDSGSGSLTQRTTLLAASDLI
jgi:peptidoglycan/xylan/chitin deacetylase (PgdA/CDA1 family)